MEFEKNEITQLIIIRLQKENIFLNQIIDSKKREIEKLKNKLRKFEK